MEPIQKRLIQSLNKGNEYDILYEALPDLSLFRLKDQLVMAGSEAGLKTGIARFLKGGLLDNYRLIRSFYHHEKVKDMVLDSLRSTRDKIKAVLTDHYGAFTYSPYESAFDEYLVSMRKKYGITISDRQIIDHAGVDSMNEVYGMGYRSKHKYILDKISYQEREAFLKENGGPAYKDWIEKEIDHFLENPSLLIREYSCVFENIYPDVVQLDKETFIGLFNDLDLSLMAELVFGKGAEPGSLSENGMTISYIKNIPSHNGSYWD